MTNKDYIEGLMRSLSPSQLQQIRKESVDNNWDWVIFNVSVFNAGAVINLSFSDSPKEIDPDTWNGYDMSIHISDVITLLDRYDLL